jgi:hypothetical protein
MANIPSLKPLDTNIVVRITEKQKISLFRKSKKNGFRTISGYMRSLIDRE